MKVFNYIEILAHCTKYIRKFTAVSLGILKKWKQFMSTSRGDYMNKTYTY